MLVQPCPPSPVPRSTMSPESVASSAWRSVASLGPSEQRPVSRACPRIVGKMTLRASLTRSTRWPSCATGDPPQSCRSTTVGPSALPPSMHHIGMLSPSLVCSVVRSTNSQGHRGPQEARAQVLRQVIRQADELQGARVPTCQAQATQARQ